ncbi:MAG: hypothetical protein HY674_11160 [Chloroflexi bacterium]|nr:hypothetical protein [Chloroflexota bacterium]
MNKTIGLQLVVYSLLLAGLSVLTHHLAPALAQPTLIAGLAGAALCLVWGLRAVAGSRGKALPILTLIPVNFVLLSQTVLGWSGGSEGMQGRRTAAVVITFLFVLSIGMLMRIAYAGAVFDGQPASSTKEGRAKSQTTGKPAAQTNGFKRA